MNDKMEQIRKKIKKTMVRERYHHTLGVMYTAGSLAMCYEQNVEQAMLAGLLHDCGKPLSEQEQRSLCEEAGIPISDAEEQNYRLLHAKTGMILAKKIYGIKDPQILSAIRYHTTGKPNMNILEKIIYIADYIEPNRELLPNMPRVRQLAFSNLDCCVYRLTKDSLTYLQTCNMAIDQMTRDTFLYYEQTLSDEEKTKAYGK